MFNDYDDIKERIKIKPKWFDENGVPRYDKFHPTLSPNIYADEVVLMKICCQACGKIFEVEQNWSVTIGTIRQIWSLKERIEKKTIHYGDVPNDCCYIGATMNCTDLEILEFWEKDKKYNWKRNKKFEIKLK